MHTPLMPSSILIPGTTVWRKCRAPRAAVLNDAAAYFAALRRALLGAERQVHIVGWDIHSQTPLVGPEGVADDGLPVMLAAFLKALLKLKPELHIDILVWDFATVYAAERELNSAGRFLDSVSGRIRFQMDSCLPLGSAQHQKFVVIDDAVAFVGGIDLTIRRWDTSEHLPDHPFRKDPDGRPYAPFHDVQCMVDGEAAAALGELAARRWRAAGRPLAPMPAAADAGGDRWPDAVPVDARELTVGIARTELPDCSSEPVDEVEQLFAHSIDRAERLIYVENQFISASTIAERLAARLAAVPTLQALIVAPKTHSSWLEMQAMRRSRHRFLEPFKKTGVRERVRILYPSTAGAPVMVHSKVMVVDDHFLRIGSANMNNRSLGADSECDLAFEATTDAQREFVRSVRRRLIGHFCGLNERDIARNEARLLQFLDEHAASGADKALRPIDLGENPVSPINELIEPIADPKTPLNLQEAARRMWSAKTILAIAGLVLAFVGLTLVWRYTSLSDFTDIDFLSSAMNQQDSPFAPLIAIAFFVLGGFIAFPVVILIAATAAVLGPWTGAITASAGVVSSAFLLFVTGRYLGHRRLQSLLGPRGLRVQKRLVGKGVIAIAILRMVPVAPFSIVNLFAGASQLKLSDFLLGTIIGMLPGIIAMAALGSQISDLATNATWENVALAGAIFVVWIAMCLGAQFVATWFAERTS